MLEEEFSFKLLLDGYINELGANLDLLMENVLENSCFDGQPLQEEKVVDGGVAEVRLPNPARSNHFRLTDECHQASTVT